MWRKNGRANPLMDWKVVECFSLSVSLSLCVSLSPSIYRATFLAIYLSTCLFMYLSIDLFIHLSIKLSIFLVYPAIHPSTYFSLLVFFPFISSSIHVHSYPSPCSSFCFSIDSSMHLSVYLFFQLSIHLSSYPCVYLVIDASSDLSI